MAKNTMLWIGGKKKAALFLVYGTKIPFTSVELLWITEHITSNRWNKAFTHFLVTLLHF